MTDGSTSCFVILILLKVLMHHYCVPTTSVIVRVAPPDVSRPNVQMFYVNKFHQGRIHGQPLGKRVLIVPQEIILLLKILNFN